MNPFQTLLRKLTKKIPSKITAKEFLAMIAENPSIFEHWETPLEITGYVNCGESNITHLSKQLTFSGRNSIGETASFSNCPDLKVATGTFHGLVYFVYSGIEKIENLQITNSDRTGWATNFCGCDSLQIATGLTPDLLLLKKVEFRKYTISISSKVGTFPKKLT
jgi:hypothetical protein